MVSRLLIVAAAAVFVTAGCARSPQTLTAEAARAKADDLLKVMSKNLGGLETFAYSAEEVRNDGNVERRVTRRVVMRRPGAIAFTTKGHERDAAAWYDGKHLTLVSNRDKTWTRGPMPPTLDEALDFLSAEYAIQMPSADLLYASPYDAVMTPDTVGGWVDVQTIGSLRCDHLAYQQPAVDWEIWLSEDRRLPCRARIIYKNEPGRPTVTVTYTDLDLRPQVTDDTFVAKIPDGYRRIKIMRHGTINDPSVEAAAAEPKKSPK